MPTMQGQRGGAHPARGAGPAPHPARAARWLPGGRDHTGRTHIFRL